jgi:dienelactone hydrolase
MSRASLIVIVGIAALGGAAQAEVKTKTIDYNYNGTTLKGFLAYDDAARGKRPGVLVLHEWWGLNDYARSRAGQLAKLGYVAFCPDMFGDGKSTEHPKEAAQMTAEVRKNIKSWQGRAAAGLAELKKQDNVDPTKLAAIGYCFGGSTALQLAYTGADLKAVVTFHAGLPVPSESQARAIKGRVLVCNGAADSLVGSDDIKRFQKALDKAKVKNEVVQYPGAHHSFTVPGVDKKGINNLKYNEKADHASWQAMQALLKETLGTGKE